MNSEGGAQHELLRGSSFVHSYTAGMGTDTSLDVSVQSCSSSAEPAATSSGAPPSPRVAAADNTKLRRREPTMLRTGASLIAPLGDHGKRYTIVLDLDETVVYARDGPLYARAHLQSLLRVMDECCEVIVWTAGERKYAKAILQEINTDNIIKHLIYRHKAWFDPKDYTKDLCRLGRDLDYVLIIENTPDCVRVNPQNGIIVEDFEGVPVDSEPVTPTATPTATSTSTAVEAISGAPTPVSSSTPPTSPKASAADKKKTEDHTFVHLMQLVRELGQSGQPVPQFLANCRLLRRQVVKGSNGEDIPIFYLTSKKRVYRPRTQQPPTGSAAAPEKVVKVNRDKMQVGTAALTPPATPSRKRNREASPSSINEQEAA